MMKTKSIKGFVIIFIYSMIFVSFLSSVLFMKEVTGQVIKIMVLFIIMLAIVHFITLLFSRKLRKDVDIFLSFFRKAAVSREKINLDTLFTGEFKELADSANRMLDEREETESILRDSKERLKETFASIPLGVITIDTDQNVILINQAAEKLIGWNREEALVKPLQEVFHMIHEETGQALHPLKLESNESPLLIARDGTRRLISYNTEPLRDKGGNITGTVLVFRDITELRQKEEEWQKTHQFEALGRLARGIGNDYNDLLTGMLASIIQAKDAVSAGEKVHDYLLEAEKAGNKARCLSRQLLTFAGSELPNKSAQPVADLIEEAASLLLPGNDWHYRFSASENLWAIEADKDQVIQLFGNLIMNAVQAMPDGGYIHISAANIVSGEDTGLPLENRRYVKIGIQDNGDGIPPELLKKVFDPYFTTKSSGTGLGLTSAQSIIEKHDGCIHVDSQPGKGSIFTVYIPASYEQLPKTEPVKSVTGQDRQEEESSIDESGSGRVLVMDDDYFVGDVAMKMLTFLGYQSEVALDGRETINLYKKSLDIKQPYDVVIMDLTIPGGMGGAETIKKLLEIDPQVKAIVSSGYSHDPVMADYRSYGFRGFIMKPYKLQDLKKNLEQVLGE